jgi:FMN-dependent oxidoreductase (nitrilotriacetate monooxygenase family)
LPSFEERVSGFAEPVHSGCIRKKPGSVNRTRCENIHIGGNGCGISKWRVLPPPLDPGKHHSYSVSIRANARRRVQLNAARCPARTDQSGETQMTDPLMFSAFVMNTASHILHGAWRRADARQVDFNSLDVWTDLVKTLERGLFDVIFFADVHGVYGPRGGSFAKHVESGLQIPSNDPSVILSALASHTEHLGLAMTSSIVQEQPFNFARKMSTLDHATKGRIAWNIVTNGLPNGARNFGYDDLPAHELRYKMADEYVEVAYKLWEGSWDDGALVQDRKSGRHGDPSRVHRIDHVGQYYSVEGPHLVSPSPQRTPLLFQAGSSPTGMAFAAAHAEAVFLIAPSPANAHSVIENIHRLMASHGRSPDDIRFFQGFSFVIGI